MGGLWVCGSVALWGGMSVVGYGMHIMLTCVMPPTHSQAPLEVHLNNWKLEGGESCSSATRWVHTAWRIYSPDHHPLSPRFIYLKLAASFVMWWVSWLVEGEQMKIIRLTWSRNTKWRHKHTYPQTQWSDECFAARVNDIRRPPECALSGVRWNGAEMWVPWRKTMQECMCMNVGVYVCVCGHAAIKA